MIRTILGVIGLAVVVAIILVVANARGGGVPEPSRSPRPAPSLPAASATVSNPGARGTIAVPVRPVSGEIAQVTRVVDGDTIDVRRADGRVVRVRYIGVNTPETVDPRRPVECFGKEASARNTELVAGKTVLLEKDISETDQYGRLLRYVWVGDTLVNSVLVEEGFARPVTFPPDVRYVDWYRAREREARSSGRGLWGACGS